MVRRHEIWRALESFDRSIFFSWIWTGHLRWESCQSRDSSQKEGDPNMTVWVTLEFGYWSENCELMRRYRPRFETSRCPDQVISRGSHSWYRSRGWGCATLHQFSRLTHAQKSVMCSIINWIDASIRLFTERVKESDKRIHEGLICWAVLPFLWWSMI